MFCSATVACRLTSALHRCCNISESWYNHKTDSNFLSLDGFNLFRKDRHHRKGGGVCIYVRNDITSEVIWPTVDSNPLVEIVVLKCKYNQRTYFLACCYYPPKPVYSVDQFFYVVACVFEGIFSYDEDDAILVFAGDLNQLDSSFLCHKYGLVQLVNTPTHDSNILDKFFTNRPDIYNNCFTMKNTVKTKHLAVWFITVLIKFAGMLTAVSVYCTISEVITLINLDTLLLYMTGLPCLNVSSIQFL
jgi:hypothetical protein